MQQADTGQAPDLDGSGLQIAIVQARFNNALTDALREACVKELRALGVAADAVELVTVPGALEIPIALDALADNEPHAALVAIGWIVGEETYHFELIGNEA
ncbi:MAG: 6,7-dimethyl-8-ribityllumazine synthase, partial [Burkholderiaceae bacterium]|nr:6,7-dimethyl-8-ribityllumazine synthase [Burkholderiaceae bacterium]